MSPATAGQARALLEHVLRDGASLAEEYPLVFGSEPCGRTLAVEEGGRVRAACAVLVRDLVLPDVGLRAGLVGSVATDPRHRGRGHATRVLERAERELAAEGCVVALLWADEPAFYERRGWREVGAERDFELELDDADQLPVPFGVRAAAPDDRGAIHRLYTLHRHRVDRSTAETAALLACPDMETLVVQRERDVIAYSCLGRGADLARTVHEWAGSTEDVLRMLRAHLERRAVRGVVEPIYLMTPASALELHAALEGLGIGGRPGVLGHGKLLDAGAAAAVVARLAGPEARFEVDSGSGEPRVNLVGPAGAAELGPGELLELLMPATGRSEAIELVGRATGLALARLPLLPWLWGLDSI